MPSAVLSSSPKRPSGSEPRGFAAPLVVTALIVVPLAAFLPLAVQAWRKRTFAWDAEITERIHSYENRETFLDRYVDVFSVVLHPLVQVVGALVVAGVLATLIVRGRARTALWIALGVAGAAVLGFVLKEVFERPPVDPNGSGYSFPSGHAIRSFAAAAVVAGVAWSTRWRWPTAVVGTLGVGLIGVAVVYHEWHWASDVLAAWCLAIAWLACVWLVVRPRHDERRPRAAPVAGSGPTKW